MTLKEYCKTIDTTLLSYDDNNISKQCKNFLEGLLEKNVNKRLTFNQTINHPWIKGIQAKSQDVSSKFMDDPDKMVNELNKAKVADDYFEKYLENSISFSQEEINIRIIQKKRKRNSE
jgi:serine/threonine protein kinase